MSVVRQLLQISAVEACRDGTIAGADVYDSRIDTLPNLLRDATRPVLIFSIEASEQRHDAVDAEGLLSRDTRLKMLVQMSVASGVEIKDESGTVVVAEIGEADAAYEALLNILDRQWRAILQNSDGEWAKIWRGLHTGIYKVSDARAVDPETGRKHAVRYTEVELNAVWEPAIGNPIPDNIEAGLAAMEADGDPSYAEVARVFRSLLAEPAGWPDWRETQSRLMLTEDGLLALGLGPLAQDVDRTTPEMSRGVAMSEGVPDVVVENE